MSLRDHVGVVLVRVSAQVCRRVRLQDLAHLRIGHACPLIYKWVVCGIGHT